MVPQELEIDQQTDGQEKRHQENTLNGFGRCEKLVSLLTAADDEAREKGAKDS